MKQKKLHRKGSDCSVLDTMTSPLSLPGDTATFGDDDPRNDVINMAACGHVTLESGSEETTVRLGQHLYDDDDDDDIDINVDSSATESESDL